MDADKKVDAYAEHAEDPKHTVNVNNFAQNVNAKSVSSQSPDSYRITNITSLHRTES
jgi:type IV secretory pathway TrbF-like protein